MKNNRFYVYSRLRKCLSDNGLSVPKSLALFWGIISVLTTAIALLTPYFYGQFVDEVLANRNITYLKSIIALLVLVFLIQTILAFFSMQIEMKFKKRMSVPLKYILFKKLISRDISSLLSPDVGEFQKVTEQDSNIIVDFILKQIVGLFCSLFFIVGYATLMVLISPSLFILSIITIPLSIFFCKYTGKKFNKYNDKLRGITAKNSDFLFDTIRGWREIKVQCLESLLSNQYVNRLVPEQKINLKWMKCFATDKLFYSIKNNFVQKLLLYCIGGFLIIKGEISIGALLMFISYTESFSSHIDSIIGSITSFVGNKAIFDRLFKVLEENFAFKPTLNENALNLTIDNVVFSYGQDMACVLDHVSVSFDYGKKVLIIGKSGEGKSTLIKLILGMHKPISGEIKINNIPLGNIDQASFFKKVGVVMQENYFLNLSIKENMKMAAPEATQEDIQCAMKKACLDEFVQTLPDKYDTVIGERGIKLSGGQKQRLAMARVFLRNPEIVILDEPTSSLDAVTESEILSALSDAFAKKTIIFISHKPAMKIEFDRKIEVGKTEIKVCN